MTKSKTIQKTASPTSSDKMLTEVELELMTVLWRLGEGSVNDVMAELSKERDLAYTSISTILRILEQKKIVTTRKEGRGHVYIPALAKTDYEAKTVKHVVDKVFDGAPIAMVGALVKHLLDSGDVSDQDLAEIKALLEKTKGSRK